MKNHRTPAQTWLKVGSVAVVLGVVLLAVLALDLPATSGLARPTPTAWTLVHVEDSDQKPRHGFSTPAPLGTGTGPLTEPPCDHHA